jgi:hypothetical protein
MVHVLNFDGYLFVVDGLELNDSMREGESGTAPVLHPVCICKSSVSLDASVLAGEPRSNRDTGQAHEMSESWILHLFC